MASSTAPRGLHVLAVQATYDLQSADWCCNLRLLIKLRLAYILCYFIRKLRLAYILCLGFLQCGIPHRSCRFYCCLAAHQRTRKKDSAEPSFPILWTPPHPPGGSAAAGHIGCRGLCQFRIPVSGAGRLSPLQHDVWLLCVRAWTVRVSGNHVGLWTFVFHWWWEGLFVPAATVGFAINIRRITADRDISSNFVWCKPISPIVPGARILKKCVRAACTLRKPVSHTV